jgi:hypothetical protein
VPMKTVPRGARKNAGKWRPPEGLVIKINSDGAICVEHGRAGSGGVARDALGFRGAWAKVYTRVQDPFIAETLPMCDAFLFARARGYQEVMFETDCQELVRCWESFSLVFLGREGNQVAHVCAKLASANNVTCDWVGLCPEFLVDSVSADCKQDIMS